MFRNTRLILARNYRLSVVHLMSKSLVAPESVMSNFDVSFGSRFYYCHVSLGVAFSASQTD